MLFRCYKWIHSRVQGDEPCFKCLICVEQRFNNIKKLQCHKRDELSHSRYVEKKLWFWLINCTQLKIILILDFFLASLFLQQNVVALIEGSHTQMSACTLSTVTGIPLIRLHGNNEAFVQCQHALQMSASYKTYSHATLDILNTFQWIKMALVFDGKKSLIVASIY